MTDQYKTYLADLFDRAADTYEQTGVEFFAPIGLRLVEHAGLRSDERVLDVGCGRGASLIPAALAVGPGGTARGIDLSAAMIAHARESLAVRGLAHASASEGDAEAPDFAEGAFDVVLAGMVLFFLADAGRAVRTWRRVLRPGGRLVMSTMDVRTGLSEAINAAALGAVARFLGPDPRPDGHPGADARFRTRESIAEVLDDRGFGPPSFVEETVRLRFDGPQAYWDWMGSSSMRVLIERVPSEDRSLARQALADALEPYAGPDGSLEQPMAMRYTSAVAA